MHKHIIFIAVYLMITSMINTTLAQEDQSKKKGELEIGSGLNFFGPGKQMSELMVKYDLDDDFPDLFGAGTTKKPQYNKVGVTFQISYSHYIGSRSQLGILLNYSRLGETNGYSSVGVMGGTVLSVQFSNISVVPLYSFELNKYLEFQTGPALMINSGNKTISSGQNKEDKYTKLTIGFLTELNLKIWNNRATFGKIGTYYLLAKGNKMGPYTTGDFGNIIIIPESKISFSYLNILFVFGLKL